MTLLPHTPAHQVSNMKTYTWRTSSSFFLGCSDFCLHRKTGLYVSYAAFQAWCIFKTKTYLAVLGFINRLVSANFLVFLALPMLVYFLTGRPD